MKNIRLFVCTAIAAVIMTSCAPGGLGGSIYTNVKSPVTATSNSNSTKVGMSKATGILGLVATGDASIDKACRQAGITKIHHVDQKFVSILGIYASYKVYVYGE